MTLLILLALVGSAGTQLLKNGSCPSLAAQRDFEMDRYVGQWYEYKRYPYLFKDAAKCQTDIYIINLNNTLTKHSQKISKISGLKESRWIRLEYANPTIGDGKLLASSRWTGYRIKAPYWVMDTDYDNYSIVYVCRNITRSKRIEWMWILIRDRNPVDELSKVIMQRIEEKGLSTDKLEDVNQDDCND